MKFYDVNKKLLDAPGVEEDYKTAVSIHPMRIGRCYAFYRKGVKTYAVPYADISRIFRRVRAVHTTLGCCGGDLEMQYIVFCGESGELCEAEFQNESFAKAAFDELQKALPNVKFGKE